MSSSNRPESISALLGALAYIASSRGSRLTKIRLVKLLYLLDVYWARAEKRTFTNWPWAFVHYGPYCRESTDAVDFAERAGYLIAESYESRYSDEDFRLYGPGEMISEADVDQVMDHLPLYVSQCLQVAVKRWHDDTYGLLDYVYFKTGPMEHARPGDRLSFEMEQMPNMEEFRPVTMLPLSNNKKRVLKEAISKIGEKKPMDAQPDGLFDKEYFDFLLAITDPETETGISGIAKMNFEEPSND